MQLRRPEVAVATDSDELGAVAVHRKVLELASSNRWWVGAAHLPFRPGHLRRDADRYAWVPVTFTPIAWHSATAE